MDELKHTPGQWHVGVRQPNSDKFIYGADGAEVANCDRLTNFPDVNLANARLIAAAPDMLEALEALHSCHRAFSGSENWTVLDDEARAAAENAIQKAKGEHNAH